MSLGCPGQPPAVPSPPATCITVSRSGNDGDCAQAPIDVKHAGVVYLATGQLQCDCDVGPVVLLLAVCCWCQCAAGSPYLIHVDGMVNSSTKMGRK